MQIIIATITIKIITIKFMYTDNFNFVVALLANK